jgi:hypothetical protein
MTVAITRLDHSAADLCQAAARTQNAKTARRILSAPHVLQGNSHAAAESCAMHRQTLCDWGISTMPVAWRFVRFAPSQRP